MIKVKEAALGFVSKIPDYKKFLPQDLLGAFGLLGLLKVVEPEKYVPPVMSNDLGCVWIPAVALIGATIFYLNKKLARKNSGNIQ